MYEVIHKVVSMLVMKVARLLGLSACLSLNPFLTFYFITFYSLPFCTCVNL